MKQTEMIELYMRREGLIISNKTISTCPRGFFNYSNTAYTTLFLESDNFLYKHQYTAFKSRIHSISFKKSHFSIIEEYLFYIATTIHSYAVNYTQNT
jgi:hypothetical protein